MRSPDLILLHAPSVYDFRKESILYGPVSDMVPSTPIFEMYPIGFTTMAEYLERHGMRTRIINLAMHMLQDRNFDAERFLSRLDTLAFGIDLHWLPHAQGSLEVASILKRQHSSIPVIFGGFSATYFHRELALYPQVDYILRGDSTEFPLKLLIEYLKTGGHVQPAPRSADFQHLANIPNLVWKDREGEIHVNPISHVPETLDDLLIDYVGVMRSVVRYRDLVSYIPFKSWLRYPATAAIAVRGCQNHCVTCGGSANSFAAFFNRTRPAYPSPEKLASDIRRLEKFSHAPVMVLGDIQLAGQGYALRLLEALAGYRKPVIFEFFKPPSRPLLEQMSRCIKNYVIEISMESHDEQVRKAFGRAYTNRDLERCIEDAFDLGCQRFDLFFMVGIKQQTYQSVMETVEYTRHLLARQARNHNPKLLPFISPMAPFLDPGSLAFEQPEKHGYRLFCRTLEEHRQALLAPSWKYVLNYETAWMNRDQIAAATYEAASRLNQIKGEYGLISLRDAEATACRIAFARQLMDQIDEIVSKNLTPEKCQRHLRALKDSVENANLGTVCDKRELEVPQLGGINWLHATRLIVNDWLKDRKRLLP